MTPIGHLATSWLLARPLGATARPWLIVGGLAPDVDFALILLDDFNLFHRGATHSLLFVALLGLLAVTIARSRHWFAAVAISAGALLHLQIDAVMDGNATNGIGVALLWPFSPWMYSPVNLLATGCPGWEQPAAALVCALPGLLWELPMVLLACFLFLRTRRSVPAPT